MMHRHISSTDECFDEKSKQIILPAVEYIALHFSENISKEHKILIRANFSLTIFLLLSDFLSC